MIPKAARILSLAGLLLAVAGCAQNRYCLKAQPYDSAKSIPPLHATAGLDLPRSNAALVVPPPPSKDVDFGRRVKTKSGASQIECLDQPPPFKPYPVGPQTGGTTPGNSGKG
jgi:hypothetical protein